MKTTIRACLAMAWLLLTLSGISRAANPFVTTEYNADPSARVFGDRVYVYPTDDTITVPATNFQYHCYSTDDMANWQDHGVIFNVSMSKWAKESCWAPDCIGANGQYYLYYPARDANGTFFTGVATSPSPTGPFTDTGSPIAATQGGIDPNVFIDDNGQAYLYWAVGGPKVCALSSDMIHTTGPVLSPTGCDNFFEGPWMFKRFGVYYMTYAAFMPGGSGLGGNGQYFDYATSTSPTGPFTYRGHFSRTSPNQPEANNIHGSQVLWKGTWYCFYHDFSISERYPIPLPDRGIDVDLLGFNGDGTLQQLAWTSTGPSAVKNLNPYLVCQAETLNQTDYPAGPHAVATEPCSEGTLDVCWIGNGDWMRYANADFGGGASSFQARIASPVGGGSIQVRLDRVDGPVVGTAAVPNTGGWQTWQTVTCPITGASGVHDIFLVASGPAGDLFNINWYQFSPAGKIPDGNYNIVAATSGNVLDCSGCSSANGTPIQLWDFWNGPCQQWNIHGLGNGYYSIRNLNPDGSLGRSLDCSGCSPENLTQLQLWDYWGGPCQQWDIAAVGNNGYRISTANPKADGAFDVLDGMGCSGAEGARVILWSWGGGGCQ